MEDIGFSKLHFLPLRSSFLFHLISTKRDIPLFYPCSCENYICHLVTLGVDMINVLYDRADLNKEFDLENKSSLVMLQET